ncbi:haloacid dehalogenase type II [Bacillus lacus]|uniref:Haloacid dehalogenase type II n=2 Tax=Metabacillus lacus TaxID=1983721 RepID=A0A7X2LY91_9BACI|nr:haloacid dehalogenase type II [Metabacillus lacus]MRX72111.1 haloacid dehalogenase type II [Metabacillus lacus]
MTSSVKAMVFDVYGTLFDVHSIQSACEKVYPEKGLEISREWRLKQLEYSFLRQIMGCYQPFSAVTRDALRYVLKELQLEGGREVEEELMNAYRSLHLYPEVKEVLKELSDKKLAVCSNGSRDMLLPLMQTCGLDSFFTHIVSVEDVEQFKPSPGTYAFMQEKLGLKKEEILFLSSNGWDIAGAKSYGFLTAWINRGNLPPEELQLAADFIYRDLRSLLDQQ